MPRVSVPADATNKNVQTLLGASAPITGWVTGQILSDPDNTEPVTLKIGSSTMTATNYDNELAPGESAPLSQNGLPMFLPSLYVRNDGAAAVDVVFNIKNT